jgi:hypothetical protein
MRTAFGQMCARHLGSTADLSPVRTRLWLPNFRSARAVVPDFRLQSTKLLLELYYIVQGPNSAQYCLMACACRPASNVNFAVSVCRLLVPIVALFTLPRFSHSRPRHHRHRHGRGPHVRT